MEAIVLIGIQGAGKSTFYQLRFFQTHVRSYFFDAPVKEAIRRNQQRTGRAVIPVAGLVGTHKRLELPRRSEGFDLLYRVRIGEGEDVKVEEWAGEPEAPPPVSTS